MGQLIEDRVQRGRDAYRRHAWHEAFDWLREADSETPVSPEDLRLLAESAWLAGEPDAALEARERAHAAYLELGDKCHAAEMALQLALQHIDRLETAIGNGWLSRAQRLLEQTPDECVAHGWQAILRAGLSAMGMKHSGRQGWHKRSANGSPHRRSMLMPCRFRAMPWSAWVTSPMV
jgi:hypothetical protein